MKKLNPTPDELRDELDEIKIILADTVIEREKFQNALISIYNQLSLNYNLTGQWDEVANIIHKALEE